jgi:hypothetical protein
MMQPLQPDTSYPVFNPANGFERQDDISEFAGFYKLEKPVKIKRTV